MPCFFPYIKKGKFHFIAFFNFICYDAHREKKKRGFLMELWSKAHIRTLLPALLVMVVLSAVFRLALGKKSLTIRMIPIQIIAVLLVLLEIGKQFFSFQGGYDLYHNPLHYCSLFLFT